LAALRTGAGLAAQYTFEVPTPPRHPRFRNAARKTAKWGGTAATVLLVAVWVVSTRWEGAYRGSSGHHVMVIAGAVYATHDSDPSWPVPRGTGYLEEHSFPLEWWFVANSSPTRWSVLVPLWALILPAAVIAAVGWRLESLHRRRARLGACPACGYDLSGLPQGGKCPECGHASASPAAPA